MITSIIFSKDRALQLDLTLKSIKQNFPQSNKLLVIYAVSEEHAKSYELLASEHEDVIFYKQTASLFLDISKAVGKSQEYVCFFTDDCIVYRKVPFEINKIVAFFESSFVKDENGNSVDFSCLSLRLGENTTRRNDDQGKTHNDVLPPQGNIVGEFLLWDRTPIPPGGYWSYALSVDGHIFKKKTIRTFCDELSVLDRHYGNWPQTPNEFESKLQRFWFEIPRLMGSPTESCVVNSPNNRVQNSAPNRHGDMHALNPSLLLDKYINGHRLKLENLDFDNIVCPHTELDIMKGLS